MRIIRYDPEIKAVVWNTKRYMKKGEMQFSAYPNLSLFVVLEWTCWRRWWRVWCCVSYDGSTFYSDFDCRRYAE